MPANQIINPAESTEKNLSALFTAPFIATGAITKGMAVQLVTTYTTTTKPVKVKKATTTGNYLVIGIATKTVASGTLVQVVTYGPVLALRHVAVGLTKGQAVLQTATNAGYSTSAATAVLGKTIGVALQTVAATVATGFVRIFVRVV